MERYFAVRFASLTSKLCFNQAVAEVRGAAHCFSGCYARCGGRRRRRCGTLCFDTSSMPGLK